MVEVSVNQENFQLSESGTLADILTLLEIRQPDGIAIAVNNDVIPRGEWEGYRLKERDKVFVIRATQGG
ncbi:MAG TPA: sulfur carrier protein ThiS [Puia sp.]|jgi:sulfur carrier protein|nr:sulfur carrier protein ThiS [Puia sp.]